MTSSTSENVLNELFSKCCDEIAAIRTEVDFPNERADKAAALTLQTQIELSKVLRDYEISTKLAKGKIDNVQASKYNEIVNIMSSGKKPTEAAISHEIVLDENVQNAKIEYANSDGHTNMLKNWMNILKDAHIMFRARAKKDINL